MSTPSIGKDVESFYFQGLEVLSLPVLSNLERTKCFVS